MRWTTSGVLFSLVLVLSVLLALLAGIGYTSDSRVYGPTPSTRGASAPQNTQGANEAWVTMAGKTTLRFAWRGKSVTVENFCDPTAEAAQLQISLPGDIATPEAQQEFHENWQRLQKLACS